MEETLDWSLVRNIMFVIILVFLLLLFYYTLCLTGTNVWMCPA